MLIDHGADINRANMGFKWKLGWTALHYLFRNSNNIGNLIEVIKLFIEKGVNINAKTTVTEEEYTPLHLLVMNYRKDDLSDLIQLLVQNGAYINGQSFDGSTPLHYHIASYKENNLIDIVQFFIQNGADTNLNRRRGGTLLTELLLQAR